MKQFKSHLALMMAFSVLVGTGTTAFADTKTDTSKPAAAVTAVQDVRSILEGLATVESIKGDKQITVKLDQQVIVLNLSEETLFINAESGIPSSLKEVKVGDNIYVYYNAAMMESLPPQTSAAAIVTGVKKDMTIPRLMTVKEIVHTKDNQISFLNTNGDMIVTVTKDTPITPFKTKQMVTYKDVQPGAKLFVYYDIVLTSYPGQTGATKVVVVSTAPEEAKEPTKVMVNGKAVELGKLLIYKQNGNYMVPLKAVSSALGFNLKWNVKTKTASIDNGTVKTDITVGEDAYFKASSKAIGLTQALPLGASAEIINGSLYVPVKLFNLLYGGEEAVKVAGETINIQSNTK